jgi:small conductance mechanosensitive channel
MHTSVKRVRFRPIRVVLLVLALSSSFASPAFGQGGKAEDGRAVAEQSRTLIEDLETREADLEALRDKIQEAKGNAAAGMLQTELVERRSRYRVDLSKLVDLVAAGEDGGADVAEGRLVATRLLEKDAETIRAEMSDTSARLIELFDVMAKGSPEEAEKARRQRDINLPTWNRLLQELTANIGQREKLGLDVEADIASLTSALKIRSAAVAGALQDTKEEIDAITGRPGSDQDPAAQKELANLKKQRDLLADAQRLTVSLMDQYGLETAALRRGIISATGKISQDILDKDVASGLLGAWFADATDWLRANGASLVFQLLTFLLILFAFWIVARIGRGAVRRGLKGSKLDISSLAREFFIATTGRLIMLFGFIIAIAQLGVEVAPLLAGLGIAGFVIGFALQDTLANFASGLMILVYRPFDVGDVIEAGGIVGKVNQMNLVSTMVLTFDNQLLVVPNNKIWGDVIRNVTHQATRRIDLTFGIGYSDDVPKAEKVLLEIVTSHDKVLKDPEPVIRLHELGDSSVNFVVRPWAKTDDYWDVYWDITREVKQRFDAEGISIPFPQRDVHLYRENGDA